MIDRKLLEFSIVHDDCFFVLRLYSDGVCKRIPVQSLPLANLDFVCDEALHTPLLEIQSSLYAKFLSRIRISFENNNIQFRLTAHYTPNDYPLMA